MSSITVPTVRMGALRARALPACQEVYSTCKTCVCNHSPSLIRDSCVVCLPKGREVLPTAPMCTPHDGSA